MRVLVNGLSIGSHSGRHVLYGHLRQLAQSSAGEIELVVLKQLLEPIPVELQRQDIVWHDAPAFASHPAVRTAWETIALPRLLRRLGIDRYFTPNGTTLARCHIPQVSLAQNPWPLVRELHGSMLEHLHAGVLRHAYRAAYRDAETMAYNSAHMRSLYRQNARRDPDRAASVIAHQGIDDETHAAAQTARDATPKQPDRVLSVSAMASWKGAETLVASADRLRTMGVRARVRLVGPWPNATYERLIRSEIAARKLGDMVEITGAVSRAQLHREYAEAKVFCLMSRCESFGIPAIEAQAFGTPVIGTSETAMAEIGGAGGRYGPAGDAEWTAVQIAGVLTDEDRWRALSTAAVANAARFRWDICSRPLLAALRGAV